MPKFAHVAAAVPCSGCGADLAAAFGGRVAFQWGYCAAPLFGYGDAYKLGDELVWGAASDGRVPAWVYFGDGPGNLGDPRYGDVLVREWEFERWQCAACDREAGGVYVLVRGGRVVSVEARDSIPSPAGVCEVGPEGELTPREDWDDHPMEMVDGSAATLVPHSQAMRVA